MNFLFKAAITASVVRTEPEFPNEGKLVSRFRVEPI